MPTIKARNSGSFAQAVNVKVRSSSAWVNAKKVYVRSGGAWVLGLDLLPVAPSLTTTNVNAYTNTSTWVAGSSFLPITSYTLQRSTDNVNFSTIYNGTSLTYTDTGLTSGTTYYYKVFATSIAGNGAASASVTRATRTATLKRQTFTSSGTFTKPIGVTSVDVLAVGGGGGTYASYWDTTDPYTFAVYPAGNGGQVIETTKSSLTTAQTSYSLTVGSGGAGAAGGSTSIPGLSISASGGGFITGGVVWDGVWEQYGNTGYLDAGSKQLYGYAGTGNGGANANSYFTPGAGVTSNYTGTSVTYGSGGEGTVMYVTSYWEFDNATGNTSNRPANTGGGANATVATGLPGESLGSGTGASGIAAFVWYD